MTYDEIRKPAAYRTFYVMSDPRSMVVSWYWATPRYHTLMGKVVNCRQDDGPIPFEDGLTYGIRALSVKVADMRTWAYSQDDPNVMVLISSISQGTGVAFQKIFDHCLVSISYGYLKEMCGGSYKVKNACAIYSDENSEALELDCTQGINA